MKQPDANISTLLTAGLAAVGCFGLGGFTVLAWSYLSGTDPSIAAGSASVPLQKAKIEKNSRPETAKDQRVQKFADTYQPALNPTIVRHQQIIDPPNAPTLATQKIDPVQKPQQEKLRKTAALTKPSLQVFKTTTKPGVGHNNKTMFPPTIALVLDDVGLNLNRVRAAVNLPIPATMAVLPYGAAAQTAVRLAQNRGHDVILHLPMQPHNKAADPGPNALRVDLSASELRRRLTWHLDRITGYVGVNNHMGSRYTEREGPMRVVLSELAHRQLFFLDSRTTAETTSAKLAQELKLPYLSRDVFIDDSLAPHDIAKQLRTAANLAFKQRSVIVIGHPHRVTLKALKPWIKASRKAGIHFVTLRTLLARQNLPRAARN